MRPYLMLQVPVAARCKAQVYGRLPAEIEGRIRLRAWMFVVSVVCCQEVVSATGWSLVQKSASDSGMS